MNYQELIEEVYQEVQEENLRGKVANYIPELATVDPHQFGIALVDPKEMSMVWVIIKILFQFKVSARCIL